MFSAPVRQLLLVGVLASGTTVASAHRVGAASVSTVDDLVEVGAAGQLITTCEVHLKVRVAGADAELRSAFWTRIGGGRADWKLRFDGVGDDLDPRVFVFDGAVDAHTRIDLAARGSDDKMFWEATCWTQETMDGLAVYRKGATMPSMAGGSLPEYAADHLAQFLSEGRTIQIGPRELLYCFELHSIDGCEASFDRQDFVVMVSLEPAQTVEEESARPVAGNLGSTERAPTGILSGFDPKKMYGDVPPVKVDLTNLPPRSATYLRCYPGRACEDPADAVIVTESYVLINDASPQNRCFVLHELQGHLRKWGWHTLEIVHQAAGRTSVLFRTTLVTDYPTAEQESLIRAILGGESGDSNSRAVAGSGS
jgi:hypothetical protein